jgi:hypothetical protein
MVERLVTRSRVQSLLNPVHILWLYFCKLHPVILWYVDPLLGNYREISSYTTAVVYGLVTNNNGVTGKRCSLRRPCDSYVLLQYKICWERCFLCGKCRGYITRSSCDYEKVLKTAVRRVTVSCERDVSQWGRENGSWGSYGAGSRYDATSGEDRAEWLKWSAECVN